MSRQRFAPVTSSLLVRKGEARPWQPAVTEPFPQQNSAATPDENDDGAFGPTAGFLVAKPRREPPEAHHSEDQPHMKKCTLKLSHEEYERLGIIAVKKDISRHALLRQAIEQYLSVVKQEFVANCSCLKSEPCSGDCC